MLSLVKASKLVNILGWTRSLYLSLFWSLYLSHLPIGAVLLLAALPGGSPNAGAGPGKCIIVISWEERLCLFGNGCVRKQLPIQRTGVVVQQIALHAGNWATKNMALIQFVQNTQMQRINGAN